MPNPSFEDTVGCPDYFYQLYNANGWTININTADYYNKCSSYSSNVSIPSNTAGFQYPPDMSCNAFAGFMAYTYVNPNAQEYLGRQLATPLIIGTKYYISFKVNLADGPGFNCSVDKIGMLFTNIFYGDTIILPPPVMNNFAHLVYPLNITDTANWTTIAGSFVADSTYKYFLIGHFFDTTNTNFICSGNPNWKNSYYFIDDVCITDDSLTCFGFSYNCATLFTELSWEKDVFLIPNPAMNFFKINAGKKTQTIIIYDLLGIQIKEILLENFQNTVDANDLPNGIYIIKIISDKNAISQKLIINH